MYRCGASLSLRRSCFPSSSSYAPSPFLSLRPQTPRSPVYSPASLHPRSHPASRSRRLLLTHLTVYLRWDCLPPPSPSLSAPSPPLRLHSECTPLVSPPLPAPSGRRQPFPQLAPRAVPFDMKKAKGSTAGDPFQTPVARYPVHWYGYLRLWAPLIVSLLLSTSIKVPLWVHNLCSTIS